MFRHITVMRWPFVPILAQFSSSKKIEQVKTGELKAKVYGKFSDGELMMNNQTIK
jgi:hypothetical protein